MKSFSTLILSTDIVHCILSNGSDLQWSIFKWQKYLQSTEEQAVSICLMFWCKIIIVEYPHLEYRVVSTCTHVEYSKEADNL